LIHKINQTNGPSISKDLHDDKIRIGIEEIEIEGTN